MNPVIVFSGLVLFLWTAPGSTPALPEMGICAHRGASQTHPENTIAAFHEAIRLGAHMIEFDVQLCKDSALVVMHDQTVDRTTDGMGKVADLTLEELKILDAGSWKALSFKDERVPTLGDVLAIMPDNIWLNVHLKGGSMLGRKVAQTVITQNKQHQTFLACKSEAAKAGRMVDPGIMICNMERQSYTEDYVDETIAMRADFIQLKGAVSVQEPRLLQKLKNAEIRINYYGTNDSAELRELFALGVEFPLVDNLKAMIEAAELAGIPPLVPVYGKL